MLDPYSARPKLRCHPERRDPIFSGAPIFGARWVAKRDLCAPCASLGSRALLLPLDFVPTPKTVMPTSKRSSRPQARDSCGP
jgi:hypothetical protein